MLTNHKDSCTQDAMPRRRTKGTLGGWRPGAGRKPELRDPAMLTITLEGEDYAALSAVAEERGVSLASVVRDAVRSYLTRRGKG
jgi:Ribbon-helix-helix protein, copG family